MANIVPIVNTVVSSDISHTAIATIANSARGIFETNLPDWLKAAPFVLWKLFERKGQKPSKRPLTVKSGKLVNARVNEPNDFLDFDDALDAFDSHKADVNGLGVVFSKDYLDGALVGVDVDKCIIDGQPNSFAKQMLDRLDGSYIEFSQSGNGLHFIFLDEYADTLRRNRNDDIGLEVYNNRRFFALTANILKPADRFIRPGQTLDLVSDFLLPTDFTQYAAPIERGIAPDLDTDSLLNIIRRSKHADEFNRLFDGDLSDHGGNWSCADFALCVKLAFWTNGNFDQIHQIVSMSALGQRDKWTQRPDYPERTIGKAIAFWQAKGSKHFSPRKPLVSEQSAPVPADTNPPPSNLTLPNDFPFEPIIPSNFIIDDAGTWGLVDKRGKPKWHLLSTSVLLVRKTIRDFHSDRVERLVDARINGEWVKIPPLNHAALCASSELIKALSVFGVDVRNSNASDIANWIASFIDKNIKHIETVTTVNHIGWQHDRSFLLPGATDNHFQLSSELENQVKGHFDTAGSIHQLRDLLDLDAVANSDIVQCVIGTAAAAPIVGLIGSHNISLHFYSVTGGGKSTASKLAWALFGNPNVSGAIPNADGTKSGLEYYFNGRHDLCALVEDIDSVSDERSLKTISSLPYQFCNNVGRLRANKDGGLQRLVEFRGSLITNGEHPLTSDNSKGGAKRRVIELYGADTIIDKASARCIYRVIRDNYGLFAHPWIRTIERLGRDFFRQAVNDVSFGFGTQCKGLHIDCDGKVPLHIDNLAVIAVSNAIFKSYCVDDDNLAISDRIRLNISEEYSRAKRILQSLSDETAIADHQRAKSFIIDWIISNDRNFIKEKKFVVSGGEEVPGGDDTDKITQQIFGVIRSDFISIIPSILHDALQRQGFDPKTVIQQLADHGFFNRDNDGKHIKKLTRFMERRVWMYHIPSDQISLNDDDHDD